MNPVLHLLTMEFQRMLCLISAQASNSILGLMEGLAVLWSSARGGCKVLGGKGMALPTAMLPHDMPPGC